jgi:exodeoxyribonuclease VII large subunit
MPAGRNDDDQLFDLDPTDAEPGAARPDTWSVGGLAAHLGRLLATALPDEVWVEGQIRNLKRAANGHVYFDLAEPCGPDEAPQAQLSVVLLSGERQLVNHQLRRAGGAVRMADGIEVRISARVRWYAPRGTLQLRMVGIDPAFTLGRLQADRDAILASLAAEGLLERNGRLPLPVVPLHIGLVTSRGSAAHADVLAELEASGFSFVVRSVDARTQGPECPASVARALATLHAHRLDAVLLVRGGGARTDLAGFDSEQIARAIATMPVPVLTGIGHEVDRSLADEVAHGAHKTPTAAAAALVAAVRAYLQRLDATSAAVARAGRRSVDVASGRLHDRIARTGRAAGSGLDRGERTLARHRDRLEPAAVRGLERAARRLADLAPRVDAHDPARLLARGWSITTTAEGRLVRDVSQVAVGDVLRTRLAGGTVDSTAIATSATPEAPTDHPPQEPPT